jgi:hypothetical protein
VSHNQRSFTTQLQKGKELSSRKPQKITQAPPKHRHQNDIEKNSKKQIAQSSSPE